MDVGEFGTQIVEVYEGYTFQAGSLRLDIGGKDVTEYLMQELNKKNRNLDKERVRFIKEVIS